MNPAMDTNSVKLADGIQKDQDVGIASLAKFTQSTQESTKLKRCLQNYHQKSNLYSPIQQIKKVRLIISRLPSSRFSNYVLGEI